MSYGFVYCWTNTVNGMKYIGSHHGPEDDGYIGSGVYFNAAYKKNPHNFSREILERNDIIDDYRYTQFLEQKHIDAIENITINEEYYNLTASTSNSAGWNKGMTKLTRSSLVKSDSFKKRISEVLTESHANGERTGAYKKIAAQKLGRTKDNDTGRATTARKLIGNTNSKNRKNKPLGKIHIHNEGERKMIFPEDFSKYPGWKKGRGKFK